MEKVSKKIIYLFDVLTPIAYIGDMLINRLLFHTAKKSNRGGFTLVELLVVIGIIAILASVALGPITHGLEVAKESAGMQTARTLGLSEFQYSTDNGTYPGGDTSEAIAGALLTGQYVTDAAIFALNKGVAYTGTPANAATGMVAANICWDFMTETKTTQATNPGLSTSDPDGLPAVYTTGLNLGTSCPTQGPGPAISLTSTMPFGLNGIAVCWKSNSAQFLKAATGTSGSQINSNANNYLFSPSFSCTAGAYTGVTP